MSRKNLSNDLNQLLQSIGGFSEGATLKQIAEALPLRLERRSLQRRLALLVKEGRLYVTGQSRSRRYTLPSPPFPTAFILQEAAQPFPLSPVALDIQMNVNRPLYMRQHTTYHKSFLENYQPNVTPYLSPDICKHLLHLGKTEGKRPAGTYAKIILNRLLIDLSWNSSRLEGNTYSLLETERLLQHNALAEGKNFEETQMILNHKAAIEFLVRSPERIGMNAYTLLNLHALLADNLLGNQAACGRLRAIPIGITKTVYHPIEIPQLIEECFHLILKKAEEILNPFEQAFFLMVHLPYLQPFEDVNKRTSRLAANIPLILNNLCPLSFIDVSQELYISGLLGIYELNRVELMKEVFVWAYERSSALYCINQQTLGKPDTFRLLHRELIFDTVTHVVKKRFNKTKAIAFIRQQALILPSKKEQELFIPAIELELNSLHEGNIARYRLLPNEYSSWHAQWE